MGYSRDKFLPLVRNNVTPEHMQNIRYDFKIAEEDLAVGVYAIEHSTFWERNEYFRDTCPSKFILNTFRTLKARGVISRGCSKDKAVAIKIILCRAGLAEVIDASWVECCIQHEDGMNELVGMRLTARGRWR